ncbi:YeiH family protein [Desulforamulus aquiferis]|uniref:Sulfate exporter family transporter n=1 Tax=Desulforamulus aquiferis TaxID=1397668 RepID=A0AAW7ZHV8_9FIRM|nr:putative sulfate exporter family transporter [Desulforamulus aquiferis]MDO7788891.1 putative sulfate exporter family transporter [Desulforamulus aquiferis]
MEDKNKQVQNENEEIVVDKGTFKWSDLWKFEDYWAIWLGVALMVIGLLIFMPNAPKDMDEKIAKANVVLQAEADRAPFKTVEWYQASSDKDKLKAKDEPLAKKITGYLARPGSWTDKPITSFIQTEEQAKAKSEKAKPKYEEAQEKTALALEDAKEAQAAAEAAGFKDDALNDKAHEAIVKWRVAADAESKAKSSASAKPFNLFGGLVVLCIAFGLFFSIGIKFMGHSVRKFLIGFIPVFILAVLSYFLAAQAQIKAAGIEYVAWALILGLLISNTVGTPKWIMPAVQTEYYIKTGLVLLGASILIGKILLIGIPGVFVTWVVTPIVLVCTYLFGQKILKIDSKSLNMTVSADMSVCGVSAAIATAAACRAKKEELTLAVGMSIIFTAIMMIVLPMFIKFLGMHEVLGGAWIGGTIDATGAVVAAGAFLGDTAMYVAATIKMIQNVMIGAIAFGVAWYWVSQVDRSAGTKVGLAEVWYRFPKFVLGFLCASIIFSLFYQVLGTDVGKVMIDEGIVGAWTTALQGWFFALAFVSIGLATNFRELAKYLKGGKPVILYICGQSFNLILTLTMAYIMFFKVFPGITEKLMGQ